jgi:hypothetical protein
VIRLAVKHLPGQQEAAPIWLWSSMTGADTEEVTRCWQASLRLFDREHTFHLFKQTLGSTRLEGSLPAGGGSLDLAGDCRSSPAAPGPPTGR